MGTRPVHVLGFPVTVNPGFVGFMVVLAALNLADLRFGVTLAACFAAFTLVHELGHALAARRFGADTTITLAFLVGLADVQPNRPLARWERAVITAAGPLAAAGLAVVVLVLTGDHVFSLSSAVDGRFAAAVRWTGLVLGLLNLAPLMPLDGGNLVALGVDTLVPGRGRTIMQWWSIAACAVAAVVIALNPRWILWAVTVGLLAVWNVHGLRVQRRAERLAIGIDEAAAASHAERTGWLSGTPGRFPSGWVASPWLRARERLLRGDAEGARSLLVRSLTAPSGAWTLPSGAASDELSALAALVPDDAPVDQLHGAWALQTVLHEVGLLRRAADYGAAAHARHGAPELAHQVARSLTQLGDDEGAVAWLRAAHAGATDVNVLDSDAELDSLRESPGFVALREQIVARSGAGP